MTVKLPRGIEAYFDADREGDSHAVAAAFTQDGIVKDKGQTHRGRDAIRKWMIESVQEYIYTAEPFLIRTEDGKTQVTAHVIGTFPGSPVDLRFFFVLAGEKVAELEITV